MKALIFTLLFTTPLFAQTISNEFAKAVPKGAKMSAAYMVVKNSTNKDLKIIKASSPIAKYVELHTHENNNGVMAMRKVPFIVVPTKGSVKLKPMSYHIMLIGLNQSINIGTQFPLTVYFDNGKNITIRPKAKKLSMGHRPSH